MIFGLPLIIGTIIGAIVFFTLLAISRRIKDIKIMVKQVIAERAVEKGKWICVKCGHVNISEVGFKCDKCKARLI